MIGGIVCDWTCDQGRSRTFDQEVAAVSICSRSRRIWKSIRPDSESSVAAALDGMCCNPFQISDFRTPSDCEALESDLHARRPCPASSADRPSLARGCPSHFFRLYRPCTPHHPSLPLPNHPPLPQFQSTPLHFAATRGEEVACRVLVEAGAKVDA